jgi:16S rRNA (cytosine967-C5)-methyltransferase
MSVVGNQRQTYLRLATHLQPHWRRDWNFPQRLQALLAGQRAFGSRDRRLYRELIYTTVRYLPWIEPLLGTDPERATTAVAWLSADIPATQAYRGELGPEWPAGVESVAAKAQVLQTAADELLPAWLQTECPEAFAPAEIDALHRRARLWLRLQGDLDAVAGDFAARRWTWHRSSLLPETLEVLTEADLTKCDSFLDGHFEVQDLGSQLLLEIAGIRPGDQWLDACAGAGGKTLQLARFVGPTGRVDAHDIRPAALTELGRRATRAGLDQVRILSAPPPATSLYDGVLVDAPCTGSGTWRRAPHLKWLITPAIVQDHAARQAGILTRYAQQVRPGGLLVYATCSLNQQENQAVVHSFLARQPDFTPEPPDRTFGYPCNGPGLSLLPARHDTDGFYVALLRRR